jgi:hypothetical protein
MSSALSISPFRSAAAIPRQQVPPRNAANPGAAPAPDPNASSTAGTAGLPPADVPGRVNQVAADTAATFNTRPPGAGPQSNPGAPSADNGRPVAAPNVDLANTIAQQNTTAQTNAKNAKAVQSGSSTISPFLDITV